MSQQLNSKYYEKDDTILVQTLGTVAKDVAAEYWILNAATSYKVEKLELINSQLFRYRATFKSDHIFKIGDELTITGSGGLNVQGKIYSVTGKRQVTFGDQGSIASASVDSLLIRRNLTKGRFKNHDVGNLVADVQNVYKKGDNILVAASSIPGSDSDILIQSETIKFSGTFPPTGSAATDTFKIQANGDHGLYTGDAVYYKPQVVTTTSTDIDGNTITTVTTKDGIADEGIYFVQRLPDTTELKLAKSRSELYNGTYITTNPITVTDNSITRYEFNDKNLGNQKIFREIPKHSEDEETPESKTLPGTKNGILANGVEICNYKSLDFIHYNKIEKIIAEKSGEDYDVINPPNIVISDSTGVGATAHARVRGSFSRFDLIDGGFDYVDVPVVTISGGNGKNAVAEVNTKLVEHKVDFNSEARFSLVSTTDNSIAFSTYHKFRDYDKVIYQTNGGSGVAGLTTGASYYVSVHNSTTVKFHKTYDDSVAGINTIPITGFGIGRHTILAETPKRVISAINVVDAGEGYETNKTTVSGVSTALNRLTITNHGYSTGEKVVYSTTETEIGGLTSGTEYYAVSIDEDTIQLAEIGPAGDVEKNLNNAQYINLTSTQTGVHNFNYPDITVTVSGQIGVGGTLSADTFRASFTPIVRGGIVAANMQDKGVGYGSSEVINHIRTPEITIETGSEAQLQPVVDASGQIIQVIVQNGGANINAVPRLNVDSDDGQGCVLVPVISGSRITSVKILNKGYGYVAGRTTISLEYPGSGAKLTPVIQTWNVNEYEKKLSSIQDDDGVLVRALNEEYGIQYAHLFAPRQLRQRLYTSTLDGVIQFNNPDLVIENGAEKETSKNHSAIIGWAYDGHPIYGPFGYINKSGGVVGQMRSGYELSIKPNRPPLSIYPAGFFVEDYVYVASADEKVLDKNNGRFCVTPEYPNGTYAYFATLTETISAQGPFAKFKEPQFPYLIGDSLHSTPDALNYQKSTNHDDYDLQSHGWVRNTKYYHLDDDVSSYAYVERPYKLTNTQISEVTYASPGGVDSVGIITGGKNYRVNDSLIFNDNGSGGYGADVRVSRVGGKIVSQISCATTSTNSVEVVPVGNSGQYKLYADSPHGYKNAELIAVSGVSTSRVNISGQYRAGISTVTFALRTGVATDTTTGIVTYFSVYASNLDNIDENDIFLIGDEKVKILNVDKVSNRVRVLRKVEGTTGSAHTATTVAYEDPRKFTAKIGFKTSFDFQRNRELYFNPVDTIARGTSVGIGTTIVFTNPGSGATNVFAPSKSLYIPGHGLKTGDELVYNLNGGSGIVYNEPNNVGVASTLIDGQRVFVARISDDLIGIGTVKVGLGSTGTFVGVGTTTATQSTIFFTGVGTGINHSFTTNYPNVVTVTSAKNVVTVSTASTHGLLPRDTVFFDVRPSVASTISVSYNDYNRRLVIDKKDVLASGISTITDEITISDHGYTSGQQIIYSASTPAGGLSNEKIYYVVVSDKDTIKLSETYNGAIATVPLTVNITESQDSTFSPINPPIKVYKNQSVEFDLSDSSLTFTSNAINYPAFKFVVYTDELFTKEYNKTEDTENFDVSSTGTVGLDGKVTLTLRKETPSLLYYQLVPVNNTSIPVIKSEIISDKDVVNYNQLIVSDSGYSGEYDVTVSSPTEFKYFVPEIPERTSYTSTSASLNYSTSSTSGIGSIAALRTVNSGTNYMKLPAITGVVSGIGSQAAFEIDSSTIGVIKKTRLRNIGFDYPYDQTLKPTAKLPEILKIDKLGVLESVGITSYGFGYGSIAPKVILFDGLTGEQKTEVDLEFTFGSNQLKIVRNTFGITPVEPRLLPTKNTNGVGISTISYNSDTKEVYVTLNTGFTTTNSFPFAVGDEVMVENVNVGIASTVAGQVVFVPTGDGFNSEDYGYKLFTITAVDENLGGIGTMAYSLDGIIADGASPGTINISKSAGRIIPKKHFPTFEVSLTSSGFIDGEDIICLDDPTMTGVVETWDGANGYLKVSSNKEFSEGHVVEGQSSRSRGVISSATRFDASYDIEATSRFENGWDDISGFLNNPQQVIQDSDYYQHFSYALKSRIDMDEWDELVGSLNHASGFKRFSNLVVESVDDVGGAVVGLGTTSYFDKIVEFVGDIDLNCVYNFDNVRENNNDNFSDQILFENQILTDYEQSTGNRVLNVDNVADQFNSNPRATRFGEVASWNMNDVKANKFVVYIQDVQYNNEAEIGMVSILTDENNLGYVNQYGDIDTVGQLGEFDFSSDGSSGKLRFFPTKYEDNNYNVFVVQYALCDIDTSVGNTHFGGSVKLESFSETVSVGTTTTIVSMGTTYQAAKVLVEVATADGGHEFEELVVIHDGTTADLIEYGQLCSEGGTEPYSGTSGFGTYHPYIDGSTLKIDFIPNVSVASTVNTMAVAISSEGSGIGSFGLSHGTIGAVTPVSIASSSSPTATTIASYNNDNFNSAYYIVQISDPDNNHHQISELLVLDQGPDFADRTFNNEFGVLMSNLAPRTGLGTFGTAIDGDFVDLVFTPNAGINVEVRCYYNHLRNSNPDDPESVLNFTNSYIKSQFGPYTATNADLKRAFNITYEGYNVFERYFDSEDTVAIGVSDTALIADAFKIPNHFFITGEKISYGKPGAGTTQSIGIGTTNVSGVGNTDKLPSTAYVIKVDANHIRLTDTPTKALQTIPEYFEITDVGIGNSHKFTATNQNAKCLFAVDNYVQSPVVATAVTFTLADELLSSSDDLYLTGITSITGGDLLQVEDEIMKVRSVGIGSTNAVQVDRAWLGTIRATHADSLIATKIQGNYNIVNNTLNFVEAPYGNNPLSSTTNPPDERDWTGITTSSTFQGRVFLKGGTPGGSVETYSTNYVFDDVSSNFNGTNSAFTLKNSGSDTDGYADDNALVLINDIIQIPGVSRNFTLAEQSGITSVRFVEDGQVPTYDINSVNLPVGGVIVSVGSSEGFGYQPRVSAGGTATVSAAGTVSSISIGNTGSGYRAAQVYDIQTSVATTVAAGSTIMTLNNENSVFKFLEFNAGAASSIGVGTFFDRPTQIISVGTTSVNIGIGSTSSLEIPAGTSAIVRLFNPSVGVVRVGVASSSVGIRTETHIGVATISAGHLLPTVHITNVGSGYTSTLLPEVSIEEPLSYDNIPLIYQTDGLQVASSGLGTQAKVDFVVGFGSDVIDFDISNTGFGYQPGQTLTIPIGGPTGIPTDPTLGGNFERFSIEIEKTFTDKFGAWSIGQLQTMDDISKDFDGITQDFQLRIAGNITSIIAAKGSPINVQDVLIVLYNSILQVPGEGYTFEGGSTIIFPEPPVPGDTCDIIFYKGNGDTDVQSIDILETVKEGDTLQIVNDTSLGQSVFFKEDPRLVYSVDSTERVTTNAYYGPGNTKDINLERPVIWCRQTEDIIVNGKRVGKDRNQYKANIFPASNAIQTVGVGSTTIYVENARPLFNQQNENDVSLTFQKDLFIVSQDSKVAAAATAVVSTAGTITSISISDGGVGYTTAPAVTIANPVGLGSTQRQTATASITAGVVTSITLGTAKTGYSQSNPPVVLIEPPTPLVERINSGITFAGDFGTIVGVATTSTVGVATGLVFSLFIPNGSPIKDATLVGAADTVSSIEANDFFVVSESNIGLGVTSLKPGGVVSVGVGTTCIDNVYQAISVAEAQKTLPGYGSTTVLDVTVSVLSYNGYDFSSLGVNTHFGNYSFGKITTSARTATSSFNSYLNNGITGLSTSAQVVRRLPLKIRNYNV
tara:strand:+ start:4064 stop:15256 length:11193 start_codon:yes stop_codon:yes gene_type:complete